MSKLVMIDSNIFIWGIKEYATVGQEHKIAQAKAFIAWLTEKDFKFLVPVPQLAELLSYLPPHEHGQVRGLFDKRFRVVPFDEMSVNKCAELIYNTLNTRELIEYRETEKVTKNKIKFDCMIVSIGITNRVGTIYSNDPDLVRFANKQIDVLDMPNFAPSMVQEKLFLKMAKQVKSSKPRHANYEEKLKFSGSFEDILKVSVKDADKKIKPKPK